MKQNAQSAQVIPLIYVDSVDQARDFYIEKLGFDHQMGMIGKDGSLDFCTVTLGGARVMFALPQEYIDGAGATASKRAVEIYIEVADVDAHHERLKKNRVEITHPLTDQWWGDRNFAVADLYGYQIWFYQTLREPKLPEGVKII
jgi:uncharacterized glyoxalase superfamily protein PhnB